ncbi:hypothetical protein OKW42_000413 [Paraburkholderia sp. WC7.3d]
MSGYQARWDHSPVETGALKTFARTIQSIGLAFAVARNDLSETGDASQTGFAGENSRAGVPRSSGAQPSAHADLQPMSDYLLNPPVEAVSASEDSLPALPSGGNPPADRIEPVLRKPDDFSDLIALADEHDDDPLQRRRESHAPADGAHGGLPMLVAADIDEADPLDALKLEYRHALLSQKNGNAHEPKAKPEDHRESIIGAPHDPFAGLVDPLHRESSVFDLLTKGKNIDTLLESLDSFGAEQIFKADENHEILALLAPRGLPRHRASTTAPLTREEHHMVSVDSHMAMPESIEYEEPEFPDDENH